MSLARYLPRTRETAEETKRRVYQLEGIAVINVDNDEMPWEFREWLRQWCNKRFGPRK